MTFVPEVHITYPFVADRGRLGNQLFQIASTVGIAAKVDAKPIFGHWDYRPVFSFPGFLFPELKRYTFSDMNAINSYEEQFVPHLHPQERAFLRDYSLFEEVAPTIKEWVQPSRKARESLGKVMQALPPLHSAVAIHVRRGDRIGLPEGVLPLTSIEYYQEAVRQFPTDQHFLVFSDDIAWCKDNLGVLDRDLTFVTGKPRPSDREDYIKSSPTDWPDMQLMSMCGGGQIISNSTYAWWGAFASSADRVYYPASWVGYRLHKDCQGWMDPSLMFPKAWTELDNPTAGACV